MLVCTKCGYVASESDYDWIHVPENINLGELGCIRENRLCCPDCGSDEITEAQQCDHCKEYFDPDKLVLATVTFPPNEEYDYETEDTLMVCPECYDDHYFKEEDL